MQQHPPNILNRIIIGFAATRPGSLVLANVLPSADRLVMRLSGDRASLTSIIAGLPLVWLTSIGAKSKQPRQTPLLAIPQGAAFILIASNFGQANHPAWAFNLRTNPQATLMHRGISQPYLARELAGEERERCWQQGARLYPYDTYRARAAHRLIPVFLLEPTSTVG